MASLDVIHNFAIGNQPLKQRFTAGRLQAAWNVVAETPGTVPRDAWADKVFGNYLSGDLDREYLHWLSNSTVQGSGNSITDAEIVSTIMTFIDAWTVTE